MATSEKTTFSLGEAIRSARGAMSQRELARRLAIHYVTLNRYEKNKAMPPDELLWEVAQMFGLNYAYLKLLKGKRVRAA